MQIKEVLLSGFSVHEFLSLKFSPGLNVITGPNGCGKTSLLDAIFYNIFSSSVPNKDSYININMDRAHICIDILANNSEEFIVEKTFYRTGLDSKSRSTAAKITTPDGRVIVSGSKAVKEYLEHLCGSESSGEISFWYLRQGDIIKFVTYLDSPDSLDKLFGLRTSFLSQHFPNLLDDFMQELYVDAKNADTEFYRVQSLISVTEAQRHNRLKNLQQYEETIQKFAQEHGISLDSDNETAYRGLLRTLTEQQNEISERYLSFIKFVDDGLRILEQYTQLRSELLKLRKETKVLRKKIEEITSNWSKYAAICPLIGTVDKPTLNELSAALSTASNFIGLLSSPKRAELLKRFRTRPKPQVKLLAQLRNELSQIKGYAAKYSKLLQEIRSSATGSDAVCFYCGQKIDGDTWKYIADQYNKYKAREQELEQLLRVDPITCGPDHPGTSEAIRASIRKALSDTCKNTRHIKRNTKNLNELLSIHASYSEFYTKNFTILNHLAAEYREYTTKLSVLSRQYTDIYYKIIQLLHNWYDTLDYIYSYPGGIEPLKLQRTYAENQLKVSSQFSDIISTIKNYFDTLIQIKKDDTELLSAHRVLNELKVLFDFKEFARGYIKKFQDSVSLVIEKYISSTLIKKINEILEDIEAPYVLTFDDKNRQFLASFTYGDVPLNRLSYGQKVILSLILASVLYIESSTNSILIIDEPTAGLDANNIGNIFVLLDKLHELSSNSTVQCIVTTHEYNLLRSGVYNVICL